MLYGDGKKTENHLKQANRTKNFWTRSKQNALQVMVQ